MIIKFTYLISKKFESGVPIYQILPGPANVVLSSSFRDLRVQIKKQINSLGLL